MKRVIALSAVCLCIAASIWFLGQKDKALADGQYVYVQEDMTETWHVVNSNRVMRELRYEQLDADTTLSFDRDNRLVSYVKDEPLIIDFQDKYKEYDISIILDHVKAQIISYIPEFDQYEITEQFHGNTGWEISLTNRQTDFLKDMIVLSTTHEGDINWLYSYYSGLDSLDEDISQKTDLLLKDYQLTYEADAVSYDNNVFYQLLDDGRIIAKCSVVFTYEGDTQYGLLLSFIIEK